ncbi:hypothetical protein ACHAXH_007875 [Discostella pseudostelligera]
MLQQSHRNVDRASILALLRRSIRCIQAMPDPNQRASYRIYVSDAFRRHKCMPSNSREAIFAYRDGMDQVDQMEYYQKQMKIKRDEKPRGTTSSVDHTETETIENDTYSIHQSNSNNAISQWLLSHLPHLNQDDLEKYSRRLLEDGFDSVEFIEKELLVEDLDYMKKAHRRVIERYIRDKNT